MSSVTKAGIPAYIGAYAPIDIADIRAYTPFVKEEDPTMSMETSSKAQECICLAVRQAARHITQFYDQCLTPNGLRTTQFSLLAKLRQRGPLTLNALAAEMVMDRTTLGRNILPLERDGLIRIEPAPSDRRSKQIRVTKRGEKRLDAAANGWRTAQNQFESAFGTSRTSDLRAILGAVTATQLGQEGRGRTAKALSIEISPGLLARADEVIE